MLERLAHDYPTHVLAFLMDLWVKTGTCWGIPCSAEFWRVFNFTTVHENILNKILTGDTIFTLWLLHSGVETVAAVAALAATLFRPQINNHEPAISLR